MADDRDPTLRGLCDVSNNADLEALRRRIVELETARANDARLIAHLQNALERGQSTLERGQSALERGAEWLTLCDQDGRVQQASPAVERASGYTLEEMRGRKPGELWSSGQTDDEVYRDLWKCLEQGRAYRNVFVNRRKDGELFLVDQTISPVLDKTAGDDAKAVSYVAAGREIKSDQLGAGELGNVNEMANGLRYLALVDPLTELPNRTLFNDLLSRAIATAKRTESMLAVVVVDVNRFVFVNERFGSEIGDQVLGRVAGRLRALAGDANVVARVGGDEFAVLLTGVSSVEDVVLFADRARHELSLPLAVGDHEVLLTVCVGVAVYPDDGDVTEQLLSRASMALSKARKRGRGECVFFAERMNAEAVDFLALKEGLYAARQQGQFEVHYQPYFCLQSQRIAGLEALARWHSSSLGWVQPSRFIPVLEDTGLIHDVGQLLVEQVCEQLARWRAAGFRAPISFNLSPQQFGEELIVVQLVDTVDRYGLSPEDLVLEITESTVMDDIGQASDVLRRLKGHGFRVAIDDFGTGYSSLSYLRRLPVDMLKIDLSFIREIERNSEDATIVNAVISMAHSLELRCIAEGVETPAHLEVLQGLCCDAGQGYHWSRALPAAELEKRFPSYFDREAPSADCDARHLTPSETALVGS